MTLAKSFAKSKRPKSSPSEDKAPRAKPLRLLTQRSEWLAELKVATSFTRETKARELETRSRAVGLEKRRAWRDAKNVWREERTGRTVDRGDRVHRAGLEQADKLRVFNDPRARKGSELSSYVAPDWEGLSDLEERLAGAPELASRWHTSRAQGKRELFERVEKCGSGDGHRITLVCRGCKGPIELEVGCNSHWFCAECRSRTAQKFRIDFERKRLGLITAATRAGLTRRRQKKSERWGERLATFTIPAVGSPKERVRTLRATWTRFWRTLREELRPALQKRSGVTLSELPLGMSEAAVRRRELQAEKSLERYNKLRQKSRKMGPLEWKKRIEFFPESQVGFGFMKAGVELSLWDMLSYLHVFEWTPGKQDGLGHPHMHVWLFSRFIEQSLLELLWRKAYAHVTEQDWHDVPRLVVDVRAARPDVAHELVKYLTKDWEVEAGTAKRVKSEVFAQIYDELDGKRMRQSSSGFAMWAVAKVCACPACGFEAERTHWARVEIVHALESETIADRPLPGQAEPTRAPLTAAPSTPEDQDRLEAFRVRSDLGKRATRGQELRAAWLAARRKQKGKG